MKKTALMAFLLAMLAPIAQVRAYSTAYYAALKAQIASGSTGRGLVYVSGSADSAGTYDVSSQCSLSSTTQNTEVVFYAFAQESSELQLRFPHSFGFSAFERLYSVQAGQIA